MKITRGYPEDAEDVRIPADGYEWSGADPEGRGVTKVVWFRSIENGEALSAYEVYED